MDSKRFIQAMEQIGEEKGIPQEKVMDTVEHAVAAAYKKETDKKGFNVEVNFDSKQGLSNVYQVKEVVPNDIEDDPDEYFDSRKQILLQDAKEKNEDVEAGDEIREELELIDEFGRIATQTAKQVIIQKIKETEREEIYKEFKEKEGDLISGTVQRVEGATTFFDLGRTNGVLPRKEQIPGEDYRSGSRFRLYIVRVEERSKGPYIVLSRARSAMLRKLFQVEVPEISEGSVDIKAIAREPGSRSKVAVISNEEGVDPIGACVGQKGARITTIINELNGENIDIVEWSEDPAEFIKQALAPAKVIAVEINEGDGTADVKVEEDQLSLAIGKDGQNVRLAAKLTGWKIDIQSPEEGEAVAIAEPEEEEDESSEESEKAEEEEEEKEKEEESETLEEDEEAEITEVQGEKEDEESGNLEEKQGTNEEE